MTSTFTAPQPNRVGGPREVSAARRRSIVARRTFRVVRGLSNRCVPHAFRLIRLFARRPELSTLAIWGL
jgi:hypothetical protein